LSLACRTYTSLLYASFFTYSYGNFLLPSGSCPRCQRAASPAATVAWSVPYLSVDTCPPTRPCNVTAVGRPSSRPLWSGPAVVHRWPPVRLTGGRARGKHAQVARAGASAACFAWTGRGMHCLTPGVELFPGTLVIQYFLVLDDYIT
jgi:hypothetical protein